MFFITIDVPKKERKKIKKEALSPKGEIYGKSHASQYSPASSRNGEKGKKNIATDEYGLSTEKEKKKGQRQVLAAVEQHGTALGKQFIICDLLKKKERKGGDITSVTIISRERREKGKKGGEEVKEEILRRGRTTFMKASRRRPRLVRL